MKGKTGSGASGSLEIDSNVSVDKKGSRGSRSLEGPSKTLEEKNQQLEALVRDLKEYTAMITHDLRAPLAAMKGFAEMLDEVYSPSLDERGRHLVDRIKHNAVHMDNIIKGLRELILLGEETQTSTLIEPAVVAETVMENRSKEIQEKRISVEIDATLPKLNANPAKIYLILDNLLSNSFKHCGKASQVIVHLGAYQRDGDLVWYIEDSGPGVEPECREKIFEVFYQHDKTLPGLGLGLSVIKRVVELYGGRIWVEQGTLGGARFCFTLPDALVQVS